MLNNVENFYLSCFVVANAIYNINRFVLQELGNVVVGFYCEEISGSNLHEMMRLRRTLVT